MIKRTISVVILSLLLLIAQEDFLKGVKAEDLMLDRIEQPSVEDTIGICDWGKYFFNISNLQISSDNKIKIEVLDDGIWVTNLENMEKKHIDDRGFMPQWSPIGDFIAFLLQRPILEKYYKGRQVYGGAEIWICKPDGANKQNLMSGVDVGQFQWSPDGKYIAYTYRDENRGQWALGIIDIKTREREFLDVFSPYDYAGFSFSPNSRMIVYCKPLKWRLEVDWINTDAEIYVINIDGTGRTQITKTKAIEKMVKWSGDGKKLIVRQLPGPEYMSTENILIILKR